MSIASEAVPAHAPAQADPALDGGRRWAATLAVILGMVAPIMASTMVNVSIADIMGAFGIGQDRVHWLQTGFLASTTVCMLLSAWFVHNFGARATYVFASIVLVTGSLLGQVTPTFEGMVLARVAQGVCAGLLQPLALNVIFTLFRPAERGKALGLFGFGTMMGPAFGPIYGGIIIDWFDWRFVFTGAVPFMLLGAAIAIRHLPGREEGLKGPRLNWVGLLLVAVAIVAFLNGITLAQREGWDTAAALGLLLLAGLAVIIFIELESRTEHPLLNVRLFAHRSFAVACLVGFVFGAGMFGSFYLMPIFVRSVQGFTGTKTGLLLLFADSVTFLVFPVAGWIAQRVNPVYPVAGGMLVFCISSLALSTVTVDSGFWMLVGWAALGRIGLGLVIPAITSAGLRGLDRQLLAYGAGTMAFMRMLGGAMGVNGLAIVLDHRADHYAARLATSQVDPGGPTGALIEGVAGILGREGVSSFERVPYAMVYLGDVISARASALSFQDGYMVLALAFAVSSVCALTLARERAVGASSG